MKGIWLRGAPVYFDMQSTTPIDPRILDSMLPFLTHKFGNPHSRTHLYGWENDLFANNARAQVADLVGAEKKEIIFTSGATESNNLALKGICQFFEVKKHHVLTTQTEHKCVLDSCRNLQSKGFDVTYLPVDQKGQIDLEELCAAIREDTAIVSIMMVNNEIGVLQPMEDIGRICVEKKVHFHSDAAQALGKVPIYVNKFYIDTMSLSAHKIYGPKGIGALYVRRRPRIRLIPQQSGGGQERGLRSGTVPTALAVGFGQACKLLWK